MNNQNQRQVQNGEVAKIENLFRNGRGTQVIPQTDVDPAEVAAALSLLQQEVAADIEAMGGGTDPLQPIGKHFDKAMRRKLGIRSANTYRILKALVDQMVQIEGQAELKRYSYENAIRLANQMLAIYAPAENVVHKYEQFGLEYGRPGLLEVTTMAKEFMLQRYGRETQNFGQILDAIGQPQPKTSKGGRSCGY